MIRAYKLKTLVFAIAFLTGIMWIAGKAVEKGARPIDKKTDYIHWVDFSVTEKALSDAYKIDISAHEEGKSVSWIELLAYLAARYGGDFSRYKQNDLFSVSEKIKAGEKMDEICADMKYYSYYKEAYTAVLGGFVGDYAIEAQKKDGKKELIKKYGLKVFSPIARGYAFNHYDDFGAGRSYGFKRKHLGHDLMAGIGTPVVAIESGKVEALGWNRYGGWRIGIRSFDKKRYYYYAHLRKDHPYSAEIYEGKTVTAGEVIGYVGMTGYSTKENVNNINIPHLHYGMQLIFDEAQKEGNNEIWIDMYAITNFLEKNKSSVVKGDDGEFYRIYQMFEEDTED